MAAAGEFDDGTAAVPGGLSGAVGRVLVSGAGIAGLTVANALTQAGSTAWCRLSPAETGELLGLYDEGFPGAADGLVVALPRHAVGPPGGWPGRTGRRINSAVSG